MAATNLPFGLLPTKYLNGASWNNQVGGAPYYIQSGTDNNIFYGDPVIIDSSGHIQSLFEFNNYDNSAPSSNIMATQPILGVFLGCSYQTTTAIDPINSANPGRMYWPQNAVTLNNLDATGFVADDPNVMYLVRNGQGLGQGTGFQTSDIGKSFVLNYQKTGTYPDYSVQGNTFTGTSYCFVDPNTPGQSLDTTDYSAFFEVTSTAAGTYNITFNGAAHSLSTATVAQPALTPLAEPTSVAIVYTGGTTGPAGFVTFPAGTPVPPLYLPVTFTQQLQPSLWNVKLIEIPKDNGNQPGVPDNVGLVILQNAGYVSRPITQTTLAA
jgi:hypothetical protein